MPRNTPRGDSPTALVAIAVAAHRSGDRELLRDALRELKGRFKIALKFGSDAKPKGVSDAR